MDYMASPKHCNALAMAEAANVDLKLSIKVNSQITSHNSFNQGIVSTFSIAAALHGMRCGQLPRPPAPFQLLCLKSLILTGSQQRLQLDSLIPHCLALGCPRLTELTLEHVNSTAGLHAYAGPPPTCASLQTLLLKDVMGDNSELFRQHLVHMPSLTTFEMAEFPWDEYLTIEDIPAAVISKCSMHLNRICMAVIDCIPWPQGTQLPCLQQLILPEVVVHGDDTLQDLLQAAPCVTKVHLNSIRNLHNSFAQEACSWQDVTLETVCLGELHRLPLISCTRLKCNAAISLRDWFHEDQPTPEQVAASVAAVQAAGGLHVSPSLRLDLYPDDMQRLIAAAPVLMHITQTVHLYLVVSSDPDEHVRYQTLLAALGQHLRCKQVDIRAMQPLVDSRTLANLPQLLPHVEGFIAATGVAAAELLAMVRDAPRPLNLTLHTHVYEPPAQLMEELRAAMQEAGHQWVTVQEGADEIHY